MKDSIEHRKLLTPAEVGVMFRVDPKTVLRWAKTGKLSYVLTLGSQHRFFEDEVLAFLARVNRP